jgi:hypothetical protein
MDTSLVDANVGIGCEVVIPVLLQVARALVRSSSSFVPGCSDGQFRNDVGGPWPVVPTVCDVEAMQVGQV